MAVDRRRLETGCRADTFFGMWLMPFEQLDSLVNTAWAVIEKGELKAYTERSVEMADAAPERGYTVQDGIAFMSLSGPLTKFRTSFSSLLGGTAMTDVQRALASARVDPEVKKVWIDIDSWGGTAEGTAELAAAIRKTNQVKPVAGHACDKACSGALWLSSQLRRFTAGSTSAVGSQGTILKLIDSSERYKQTGLKPVIISTSHIKGIGAEGVPITDADKKELQQFVDQTNEPFRKEVTEGRKLTADQSKEVASARVYVGESAKQVGLVDAICTRDEALDDFRKAPDQAALSVPAKSETQTDATSRSSPMAFNAKQLETIRGLPGAPAITEQNAEEQVVGFTSKLSTDLSAAQQGLTAKDQTIADLRKQVPVKVDATIASGHVKLASKELTLLQKSGKISPEQSKVLTDVLMDGNEPKKDVMVGADGTVYVPMTAVSGVIELNKPNGLIDTKETTAGQPVVRTEPGSGTDDKPQTLQELNATRAQYNLPPLDKLPA